MPKKRAEEVVQKELDTARAEYQKIANTANAPTLRKASEKVKGLQVELNDLMVEGAKECPECGTQPIAFIKRAAVYDGDGVMESGPLYEVGCPQCPIAGDPRRARGPTAEQAVKNWNAGRHNTKRVASIGTVKRR